MRIFDCGEGDECFDLMLRDGGDGGSKGVHGWKRAVEFEYSEGRFIWCSRFDWGRG